MSPYLRVPILAFYSAALYRSVAREWRGLAVPYLLALLFFCWFLNAIGAFVQLNRLADDPEFLAFVDQIPPITIQDGVVSTDVSQPYFMAEDGSPGIFFIIDTTGEITSLDENVTEGVLLTRDHLYLKREHGGLQELDLSQVQSFYLDRERIRGWVGPFALVMALATFLFMPFFALAYRLALSLFLSVVGQAGAQGLGISLEWKACFRLAVVAMSPGLLIATLVPLMVPGAFLGAGWALAFGALHLGYLTFAVLANRSAPPPTTA